MRWLPFRREISLVIDKRVERFREKREQPDIHDETHRAISEQLAQIENRTYLWVSLIFPELDKNVGSSQGTLLKVIRTIPSTVQEAYERILSFSKSPRKARKLLHFVLAAQRPLTLGEMNTALAHIENCISADDLELEPEPTFRETVKELCGLFVSVSDSRIYLIHQTAREILLGSNSKKPVPNAKDIWMHSMDLSTSHFELAKTCLLYLHLSELIGRDPPMSDQNVRRQALRSYSREHWRFHVLNSDPEALKSLMNLMLSMTTPGSQAFKNWTTKLGIRTRFRRPSSDYVDLQDIVHMDQLSVAVTLKLRSLVSFLLEREEQSIEEDFLDQAAVCAIRSCPDIFYLFWDNGLDLEAQLNQSRSFLHEAAEHERIEIAQRLIEAGAAVNREDGDLREPLYFAVRRRSVAMLSLLIEEGARVNHKDIKGETVLHEAVRLRSLEMTAYMLKHGAEAGSSDCKGRTALVYAAEASDRDLTSLLIEHGAQGDSKDQYGRTPLSYAAEALEDSIVADLIQKGAQVDMKCKKMRTPLSYAAEFCTDSIIKTLIKNGAAVDSSDWRSNTPLMYAAINMKTASAFVSSLQPELCMIPCLFDIQDAIKLLLDMGANPVTLNDDGDSPLSMLEKGNFKHRCCPDHESHTEEEIEAAKAEIKGLLKLHGSGETKSPTSSDTLSQVVDRLTEKLIEIANNSMGVEPREYQIAIKSSVQLFHNWKLHPTVVSIASQYERRSNRK